MAARFPDHPSPLNIKPKLGGELAKITHMHHTMGSLLPILLRARANALGGFGDDQTSFAVPGSLNSMCPVCLHQEAVRDTVSHGTLGCSLGAQDVAPVIPRHASVAWSKCGDSKLARMAFCLKIEDAGTSRWAMNRLQRHAMHRGF